MTNKPNKPDKPERKEVKEMNEKIKILKMVEEGKITADEAAQLLGALGEGKKGGESSKVVDSIMNGVSAIVKVIPETIGGAFSFTIGEEKEIKVKKGDKLLLKSVGSSINLSHHDKDEFTIKPNSGLVKTKKLNSTITSKVVGGSADILYPSNLSIAIKDVGGTIDGTCSGKFSMKQMGGTAKLTFEEIIDVSIDSKGGTITLFLDDCDVSFDISAPDGSINFEVPAEFETEKEEKVKGKIKKGKGRLVVRAVSGEVSVLPIKRK